MEEGHVSRLAGRLTLALETLNRLLLKSHWLEQVGDHPSYTGSWESITYSAAVVEAVREKEVRNGCWNS